MDKAVVGLTEAIEALRGELMTAAAAGGDQAMRFSIEPVELTVQVAVTKDAKGKIGWAIFQAGGRYENVTTQTLTLRLAPLWLREDGTLTSDFAISSPVPLEEVIGRAPAGRARSLTEDDHGRYRSDESGAGPGGRGNPHLGRRACRSRFRVAGVGPAGADRRARHP